MNVMVHIFKTIISTDRFFFFHFFKMLIFEVHRQGIMLKKIWAHQILAKPKTIAAGGFSEGTQCLGEGVGSKTLNRFFCIKHTKMVMIKVNK